MMIRYTKRAYTQHGTCQGIWLRVEDVTTIEGEDQRWV